MWKVPRRPGGPWCHQSVVRNWRWVPESLPLLSPYSLQYLLVDGGSIVGEQHQAAAADEGDEGPVSIDNH